VSGAYTSNSVSITIDAEPTLTSWDYYLSPTGNNANAGTSPGAAWRTLLPLQNLLVAQSGQAGGNVWKVKIEAGTYDGGLNANIPAPKPTNRIQVWLDCDPGVIIRKGASSDDAGLQAFDKTDMYVLGNPAGPVTISGWSSALDGNALGVHGTGFQKAWNCNVPDAIDCWSAHTSSTAIAIDCTFAGGTKSSIAHIDTSTGYAARCTWTGANGATLGIGRTDPGTSFTFYDCIFVPVTDLQAFGFANSVFHRCRVGTLALSVNGTVNPGTTTRPTFYDCYLNIGGNIIGSGGGMHRCYGGVRGWGMNGDSLGATWTVRNCVLKGVGPSGDYNGFVLALADIGSEAISIRDCVFTNWNTAVGHGIGSGFSPTARAFWNANSECRYCSFWSNTTNIAAWMTTVSNNITTNPQLGPCNSYNQADWCVGPAGPCVGAGSTSNNIGFTAADLAALG
jgi:hypothetical protein